MLFFIIILFGFNVSEVQLDNPNIDIVKSNSEGIYYALYYNDSNTKADTISAYGYAVKLQDFKIHNDKSISLIIQSSFGGISYELFGFNSQTKKYYYIDLYPIGTNQMRTKGFKSGGENINPKFRIL